LNDVAQKQVENSNILLQKCNILIHGATFAGKTREIELKMRFSDVARMWRAAAH
jgi:hypothetical protein